MSKAGCCCIGLLYLCAAGPGWAYESAYDVRDYGAIADGKSLCTKSIQRAIEQCAKDGGGTVYLPPGTFLSGTLFMKSGVTLRLDAGCTLLGSRDLQDYPETVPAFRSYTDNYTDKSLIYGEDLENISIIGTGTIDGQGRFFKGPYKVRPYMMRFIRCRNVVVKDVTIKNSPMWVQHYLACDDVRITGITVKSRVNHNNDGIDIDSCHRVVISDCNIDSGDDAIVLKSTSARVCRDVVVNNCVLSSQCNALKMGTESNGGFENIVLTGCLIYDTGLAGVALEIVDGGTMDRIVVSDMTMNKVGAPIFLRLGNRARPFKKEMERPGIGTLRNVTIANVEATGANPTGCAISGLPQAKIQGLTLGNLRLSFAGGGTKQDAARDVPENADRYPEYSMFGKLPAYGLYCRHVKGIRLANVQLHLEKSDMRHAVVFDDVKDAVIDQLDAASSAGACSTIRLTDVQGALIRGCRPKKGTDVFLKLEGAQSRRVCLVGNDLSGVAKIVETGPDVARTALAQMANLVD
ncbi:MAG: glycoside hydrolase family 28 protein [Phycisphaerales bacterium]|nr:MAG: glycoside hydrolase family 28 protein [Phycisphaerales bacterium]